MARDAGATDLERLVLLWLECDARGRSAVLGMAETQKELTRGARSGKGWAVADGGRRR